MNTEDQAGEDLIKKRVKFSGAHNNKYYVIENSGHSMHIDNPRRLAEIIISEVLETIQANKDEKSLSASNESME